MTSPQCRRVADPRSGFTLLEVMIAAAILATMGAVVFGSFRQAWRQKEEIEAADDRYAQVRAALDIMVADVTQAFLSQHFDARRYNMSDPDRLPTFFKGEDRGRRDTLDFTAVANERLETDSKTSDQAALRYWIDRDPDNRNQEALFRRVNPILDEDARRRGRKAILCSNVKGLDLQYWDVVKGEWVDEWDTSRTERLRVLPERVKISLLIEDETGKERRFTTQAKIMLQRRLEF